MTPSESPPHHPRPLILQSDHREQSFLSIVEPLLLSLLDVLCFYQFRTDRTDPGNSRPGLDFRIITYK